MNYKFSEEVGFLQRHYVDPIVLRNSDGACLVASAALQGRVMTSAFAEDEPGFGWINRELISSVQRTAHINAFGGEERLWIAPEGGQFSLYFPPKSPFEFEYWQVPPGLDSDVWDTTAVRESTVTFSHHFTHRNWSGFEKNVALRRTVTLLERAGIEARFGIGIGNLHAVGYESENTLSNAGSTEWNEENGPLAAWILGMFPASAATMVIAPFHPEAEGPVVRDDYFGRIPDDRLRVDSRRGRILFRADGLCRGKLGLSGGRTTGVLAAFDAASGTLTLVQTAEPRRGARYAASSWEFQSDPLHGDAVNAYNDGPQADGGKLGAFFELESSSPAGFLQPGDSLVHVQRTCHLSGDRRELDQVAEALLNGPLSDFF